MAADRDAPLTSSAEVASKLRLVSQLYKQKHQDLRQSLQAKHMSPEVRFSPRIKIPPKYLSYSGARETSIKVSPKKIVEKPTTQDGCTIEVYERLYKHARSKRNQRAKSIILNSSSHKAKKKKGSLNKASQCNAATKHFGLLSRAPLYAADYLQARDKKLKKEFEASQETFSFRPKINSNSRKLAERLSRHDHQAGLDAHTRLYQSANSKRIQYAACAAPSPEILRVSLNIAELCSEEGGNIVSDKVDVELPAEDVERPSRPGSVESGNLGESTSETSTCASPESAICTLARTKAVVEREDHSKSGESGIPSSKPAPVGGPAERKRTYQRADSEVQNPFYSGVYLLKQGRMGKPHWSYVKCDSYSLFWTSKSGELKRVAWKKTKEIAHGYPPRRTRESRSKSLSRSLSEKVGISNQYKPLLEGLCFSIVGRERNVVFQAETTRLRDVFVEHLREQLEVCSHKHLADREALPEDSTVETAGTGVQVVREDSLLEKLKEIELDLKRQGVDSFSKGPPQRLVKGTSLPPRPPAPKIKNTLFLRELCDAFPLDVVESKEGV